MNAHFLRMHQLVSAAEKITGDQFKVAGFGNGDSETYCLVITSRDNPDSLALVESVRMITDGILTAMRTCIEMERQQQQEEDEKDVIKH